MTMGDFSDVHVKLFTMTPKCQTIYRHQILFHDFPGFTSCLVLHCDKPSLPFGLKGLVTMKSHHANALSVLYLEELWHVQKHYSKEFGDGIQQNMAKARQSLI